MAALIVVIVVVAMTAGTARAAIGVTVGEPTLSNGSVITVPLTVSCSPFDPSLTTFTTLVSVTVEQGHDNVPRASGALSAGYPSPMVFVCDGTSHTVTVTAVADPSSPRLHPGPAVVSVFARAMAGVPCPDRPLCFGFVDTQSITETSTVQLMAMTPQGSGTQEAGARIGIFGGATQSFPAGQPFHFSHGWLVKPDTDGPLGLWSVSLTLDGVQLHPDFIEERQIDDPVFGHLIHRVYVFNFPNGLTGTHVFAGTFWGPCDKLVAEGFAAGPCVTPNAVIAADGFPVTTTVTFVA
jgi:hypothetical protein